MFGVTDNAINHLWFFFCAASLAYVVLRTFYNLYLHPLAKFPGPISRAAFFFPQYFEIYTGDLIYNCLELHEKFGDIVRISPDTISIIDPNAWRDIYGQGNKQPMAKCSEFYWYGGDKGLDIISASDASHTRMRRLLNHAFSEQALRSQENIINFYISLMISKLQKRAASKSPVDIMKYLNFTTFDITGDLSFGEPFGSLKSEEYDHWIADMFSKLRMGSIIRVVKAYGLPVERLIDKIPVLAKARDAHDNYTKEKTARRLEKKTDRKDFISYILRYNDERGMTHDEIKVTSGTIIMAGSETSATLLSGAIYYLLKNPSWLEKLQRKVRTEFLADSRITFASTASLKILNSIIYETSRLYPPIPVALPRVVPKGGATVAGTYIPQDTKIGIPQYAAYRSSRNFTHPENFAPERFLGDDLYTHDKRSILQPFSVGPRNCIGQNLAWAEMRMILARLMWVFDLEMMDASREWEKQKAFVLWNKPSLMVKLKVRKEVESLD